MSMQTYMKALLDYLSQNADNVEVPVAAAIIKNDNIISIATNSVESNQNPILHAEINAITKACQLLNTKFLNDCTIYVTLEPCPMCAMAISFARIPKLVFGAYDIKSGGVENGPRIYNNPNCHFKPEVYGGILEDECKQIMQDFFANIRSSESVS